MNGSQKKNDTDPTITNTHFNQQYMNRVAGPWGPTWPYLSYKGCNVNISPIRSRKAASNYTCQELHMQYMNQGVTIWMGNTRLLMDLLFWSSDARYLIKSCRCELSHPKNKQLRFEIEFVQDTQSHHTIHIREREIIYLSSAQHKN